MKKLFALLTIVILGFTDKLSAQTTQQEYLAAIEEMDLPIMEIVTVDGEVPTYETVSAPAGCLGKSITNATKVPARMTLRRHDDIYYDSGDYVAKESGLTIKVRGNTSAYSSKKPYKLKLQKKADLLARGNDKKYKDKNWLLMKDDKFYTPIGLQVNRLVGMQWTPEYEYVNVVLNGKYIGLYLLIESVEQNDKCRLNVDEDTGYIFEYDAYWWNEDIYVKSPTLPWKLHYTFKHPDSDDITEEQIDYFTRMITAVEYAVADGTYPDLIDVESFAAWILAHDMLGNYDAGGSNWYMTKYDSTEQSKVMMANLWDFDELFKMENDWDKAHNYFLYKQLFNNSNKLFAKSYKDRWEADGPRICQQMVEWLNEFMNSDVAAEVNRALVIDNARWKKTRATVNERYTVAIDWFTSRLTWLSEAIPAIPTTSKLTYMIDGNIIAEYDLEGGDPITPEEAPEREGYNFGGWTGLPDAMTYTDLTVTGTYFAENDINQDGTTDIVDVLFQVAAITGENSSNVINDLNHDGMVDVSDVIVLIENITSNNSTQSVPQEASAEATEVKSVGIEATDVTVYSVNGTPLSSPQKGINIVKKKLSDGSVETKKVLIK